ncbi:mitochondrial ribosomal protein S5 isoform X1 [Osmia lignaria lignaria]|uniref:mitochondrial ribosomal protein S5 isoform X1 n=1 Tax=Osmia lignaria lignaria TaxID=1437193 RepID=UPI001478FB39|nr:28S ribosomal protein S5, mitochondrial isoform X1 [Osmia lignaria]
MASGILRVCKIITSCTKSNYVINNVTTVGLLIPQNPLIQNARSTTSFFMKRSAADLWKSVTSVSNAGKRRGRGKNLPKMKDLNKGQRLGYGKIPIVFPGLNAPVVKGDTIVRQQQLSEETVAQPVAASDINLPGSKRHKIPALKRGYTGASICGRTFGAPDPVEGDTFENFESWVLFNRMRNVMTSSMGRNRWCRAMVITGNKNGLAGFAMAGAPENKPAITAAKNKAGQRLIYIERYNEHTVMHDFFTQFGHTKIYVEQKHQGYGLKCHRIIRTCCEALGIKDMYAKVEGAINVPHIVKAFFIGLLKQKSFQEMANEKQLHVVEMRRESSYFPTVLASPAESRKETEISSSENLDYKQYLLDGRVFLRKKPYVQFYTKLPSWDRHLRKVERHRGQYDVRIRSRAETGDICSFLSEKYPEAKASKWRKHDNKEEDVEE